MLRIFALAALFAAMLGAQQPVTFPATDGVRVYGALYPANNKAQPIILLFHQAGSNHAEYSPIAPELVKTGFNALAIDQRSGGSMWGVRNRTAARVKGKPTYMDAYKDLEGAIAWTRKAGYGGPIIVWGSSYSASLVFLLAAQHPEIKGLLAFSPGEYLGGKDTVKQAASKVQSAVFITSAKDPEEEAAAKAIYDVIPSKMKTMFTPGIAGVHGSSALRRDRNPKGADEYWKAVDQFLAQFRS
jgi:dienelactone hydrolase